MFVGSLQIVLLFKGTAIDRLGRLPSLLCATTIALKTIINETSSQEMRSLLRRRIIALRAKENSRKYKSQGRYTSDYDNRVRETPKYIPGSYVFVDNSPIDANQETVDAVANQAYHKLQPPATGPFKVI